MAKNKGTFLIDNSISQTLRTEISERIHENLDKVEKSDNQGEEKEVDIGIVFRLGS